MANLESMQTPIESPLQKIDKNFEGIKNRLSSLVKYKDSKGEQVMIVHKNNEICIYKALYPNKDMNIAPSIQNIKSKYSLIRNNYGDFSLQTETYKIGRGGINLMETKSSNRVDNLTVDQIRSSLKIFETRINEANTLAQNNRNEQFKKMQQYAYNQEIQDKNYADNLINGLDDSQLT